MANRLLCPTEEKTTGRGHQECEAEQAVLSFDEAALTPRSEDTGKSVSGRRNEWQEPAPEKGRILKE